MSEVLSRRMFSSLPVAVRAEGCRIWDAEGREYIDACGGALVTSLGHNNREVIRAINEQLERIAFVHGTQFTTEVSEELCARIAQKTPGTLNRISLVSSGSDATEAAIKFARQYHLLRGAPKRERIIGRSVSYHGNTGIALGVSGRPRLSAGFEPLLYAAEKITIANCFHCAWRLTFPSCELACAKDAVSMLERVPADRIAAVIVEPITGASGGLILPPPGYLQTLQKFSNDAGILLIADEVMTGFGRTGRWFASEHFNFEPDILVFGKGVAAGYAPLAGIAVREELLEPFMEQQREFTHGHTYSFHPVSAAAGLATVKYLEEHHLVERSAQMGTRLLKRLQELLNIPWVGAVRGLGLFAAVELVADKETLEPFPSKLNVAATVEKLAREAGLLVYPCPVCVDGVEGDAILLGPPFTISEEDLALIVDRLAGVLCSVRV